MMRPHSRAFLFMALAAPLVIAQGARAGGDAPSCQKALKRSVEAVAGYGRQQTECVRAEIGLVSKGKKVTLCVGDMNGLNGMELTVRDKDGNRIAKEEGVDQTLVGFSVGDGKKGTYKLELNPTALGDNVTAAHYFMALMAKKRGDVYVTDFIFDKALDKVKAIETAGFVVEHAEFDTLALKSP